VSSKRPTRVGETSVDQWVVVETSCRRNVRTPELVVEICKQTDRQTDRNAACNTSYLCWSEVNVSQLLRLYSFTKLYGTETCTPRLEIWGSRPPVLPGGYATGGRVYPVAEKTKNDVEQCASLDKTLVHRATTACGAAALSSVASVPPICA